MILDNVLFLNLIMVFINPILLILNIYLLRLSFEKINFLEISAICFLIKELQNVLFMD